jgi:hypothetical protein
VTTICCCDNYDIRCKDVGGINKCWISVISRKPLLTLSTCFFIPSTFLFSGQFLKGSRAEALNHFYVCVRGQRRVFRSEVAAYRNFLCLRNGGDQLSWRLRASWHLRGLKNWP